MNPSDHIVFSEMLGALSEVYSKPLSEFAISIYWNALKAYDVAAVRSAFDRHVKNPDTGQFMPKPADLIRMMGGTTQDSAMVAFSKVDKALRQIGVYRDVVFDDPLIHRVLHDMGGWIQLGAKTDDDWPFVTREFENRYRGYRTRNDKPDFPAVLTGIASANNSRNGFPLDTPVFIGNPDTCRHVMDTGGSASTILQVTEAGYTPARLAKQKAA